ncbi:MFS general substrate transporter [Setomelanomma holmii]|uniref:MFS general substrate transporter n=1 Tax=Setomelanomma holmii TaxID=210430 RepID=A0A9P4GX61_9PLEO|nr:MFS general substrate transporter [Setomelanomma holmii]
MSARQRSQHTPNYDHEHVPLLGPPVPADDDENDRDEFTSDFAHLSWYRKPSIGWIMIPYLIMALIFGGIITPRLNLIVDLVCRQYYLDRHTAEPDLLANKQTIVYHGSSDRCRTPEVSRRVSVFMLTGTLLCGVLSAVVSPRLGSLSDLYGRKPIFIFCSLGSLCGEIITVLAASHRATINVNWILLSFVLEGMTGSGILAMAMVNTYATDCLPSQRHSVAFGYLHGCTFVGVAVGPLLAGCVVKWSHNIIIVFWIMLVCHAYCVLFVLFCVPESISKRRQENAREKAARTRVISRERTPWVEKLRHLNPLEPLQILYPTGPGSTPTLRRNLMVLAAMDTIMFGVAMGSMNVLLIYVNYQFGWGTFESGRYMTIVNSTRVAFLLVMLPAITYLVRHRRDDNAARCKGIDSFDLNIIRIGIFCETLGWIGYSLAREGELFIFAGVIAAAGGVASPALQSALTKHVPSDQTGQLLGANGLLHALTLIVSPVIFNAIFAITVGRFTQAVFVCLASTFGVAFIISWSVQPNGECIPVVKLVNASKT